MTEPDTPTRTLTGSTTPAGTFTRSLPIIGALPEFQLRPWWQLALWWLCYLSIVAAALWLSTRIWDAGYYFWGGAAYGTTFQLILLPWRS